MINVFVIGILGLQLFLLYAGAGIESEGSSVINGWSAELMIITGKADFLCGTTCSQPEEEALFSGVIPAVVRKWGWSWSGLAAISAAVLKNILIVCLFLNTPDEHHFRQII